MRHADHEPGTREDCDQCRKLSYEPGWYKALRDERVVARADASVVAVPDAEQPDVQVVAEEASHEPARRRR
jgi:hypothetical protein